MSDDIIRLLAARGLDGQSKRWAARIEKIAPSDVERVLSTTAGSYSQQKIMALVSPAAEGYIEQMAQIAHKLTIQRFGKTIQLYAPLYVSNFCVNRCLYCGYNAASGTSRTRLTIEEALKEANIIASEGFKDLLLVSGEDREYVTIDYLAELAQRLRDKFSSISIEVYPLEVDDYEKLFRSGIEGVTLYQETYDRKAYSIFHPAGPKSDYNYRLATADRAAKAGMRKLGLGSLLGLTDWRFEAVALAAHANYLMKRYWRSQVSFSFPRLRPAHKVGFEFKHLLTDKNLVQLILAMRLCFANAGIVISTRERAELRDRLINLGVTRMSAGSKTNPGGYSGRNTVNQFEVDDHRSAGDVAEMIRHSGMEAVWKDWEAI